MSTLVTVSNREDDPAKGLNAAVAAVLNGERTAAGMTFDELAAVSDISKRTLMRLLSTKDRHIELEVLEVLAGVFHTTPIQILQAANERRSRPLVDPEEEAAARAAIRAELAKKRPQNPRPARKVSRPRRQSQG